MALRDLRLEHHLSQWDLAKFVGCSDGTISRIELGRVYPSMDLAIRLAKFFDTSLEEIVGWNREKDAS
ncbi:MAG: helix-turn-helix domain-containing protein [Liquorilactobacillus nagelii]|uniref:helix-turn-helix transcriptional regulator n=1 Tax=Lactobacillaceae TaxID=33958 RepID=UPI0039EA720D